MMANVAKSSKTAKTDIVATKQKQSSSNIRDVKKDEALTAITSFLQLPLIAQTYGRMLSINDQAISLSRAYVEVCVHFNSLFEQAEQLESEIKQMKKDHKFRIPSKDMPVQQLKYELGELSKATVSKMRVVGRQAFLADAQYEKLLPAARETLYLTASSIDSKDPLIAEEKFKKITNSEDYRTEAPRSVVKSIINQVIGNSKKQKNPRPTSDVSLVRKITALASSEPGIKITLPGDTKKRLSGVADMMVADKKFSFSSAQYSVWTGVIA
jgi:uncharacterized protein YdcH (DUF465 family)